MGYFSYNMMGYSLTLIALVISLAAQFYVNSRYNKYRKVNTKSLLSGVEVARKILDENGLSDVYVTEVNGLLSDHYDPNRKTVRLSRDVFHGSTIASVSIAAHECGHAVQHKEGYFFIKLRGAIIPFVNFASKAGYFAILIGFIFNLMDFVWAGIGLELVILLFQLITLPTELDASKRALKFLENYNLVGKDEIDGSRTMLRAAAFTYVASIATTVLEIFRLILIASNRDDR